MPSNVGAEAWRKSHQFDTPRIASQEKQCAPRSADQVYDMNVDYHLGAAASESKGDVNFRVDYTNLQEYWNKVTDSPSKHKKRWFGDFDAWFEKVTSIVKDEKGYLPLTYEEMPNFWN